MSNEVVRSSAWERGDIKFEKGDGVAVKCTQCRGKGRSSIGDPCWACGCRGYNMQSAALSAQQSEKP